MKPPKIWWKSLMSVIIISTVCLSELLSSHWISSPHLFFSLFLLGTYSPITLFYRPRRRRRSAWLLSIQGSNFSFASRGLRDHAFKSLLLLLLRSALSLSISISISLCYLAMLLLLLLLPLSHGVDQASVVAVGGGGGSVNNWRQLLPKSKSACLHTIGMARSSEWSSDELVLCVCASRPN